MIAVTARRLPRTIYSLWLQGRDAAPDVVKLCFDRWERLNPDYDLRVLERRDFEAVLRGFPVDPARLTVQAASNVCRVRLLGSTGGVWADATLLPMIPLRAWLTEAPQGVDLFGFHPPGRARPIASWFLACGLGSYIARRWQDRVEAYWYKPRTLHQDPRDAGFIEPADPTWEVSLSGGAARDSHPYFWFHYLFGELLETDPLFAQAWSAAPDVTSAPATGLQRLLGERPGASEADVAEVARRAPVQKLDWRHRYPIDLLSRL